MRNLSGLVSQPDCHRDSRFRLFGLLLDSLHQHPTLCTRRCRSNPPVGWCMPLINTHRRTREHVSTSSIPICTRTPGPIFPIFSNHPHLPTSTRLDDKTTSNPQPEASNDRITLWGKDNWRGGKQGQVPPSPGQSSVPSCRD